MCGYTTEEKTLPSKSQRKEGKAGKETAGRNKS